MPAYITEVLNTLNSGIFTLFLEKLTGIKGLIPDPHLKGGGIHYTKRGGKLGVHRDFNFYPRLKLYRRLNIIIFLNKDWDDRWEGHLELWDKDLKNRVKKVAPKFNRVVIFETSNISYHGHPVPLNTPDDIARKSLALYYYSVDYPYQDDLEPHSTIFKDDLVN
jgi:Rps23 Pro-64 3,4-dihydroxylase Tpa1-like proline 4-hydroxylase